MTNVLAALLIALFLSGCATNGSYGNFINNPVGLKQQEIAKDTVEMLAELYPPAKSRISINQDTPDVFGVSLVRGLREKGYAVTESGSLGTKDTGLPLNYIVDSFLNTDMYRVTLLIGKEQLTRPYTVKNGEVIPAGYWARKE